MDSGAMLADDKWSLFCILLVGDVAFLVYYNIATN